ncbi:hypothetical protein BGM19_07125 [Streptomyces agglomeratus]|nr:hypothetical protein BGM19_07125 [Streptomyces agglomeratus]
MVADPGRLPVCSGVAQAMTLLGFLLRGREQARVGVEEPGNPAVDPALLAAFVRSGGYDRQLRRCQRACRERRDTLTAALGPSTSPAPR